MNDSVSCLKGWRKDLMSICKQDAGDKYAVIVFPKKMGKTAQHELSNRAKSALTKTSTGK